VRRGKIIFTDLAGVVSYFKLQLNPISLISVNAPSNYYRKALELLNEVHHKLLRLYKHFLPKADEV